MPLKVLVAGAGLGGLGAAIALARAGHNVEVWLMMAQILRKMWLIYPFRSSNNQDS